MAGNHASLEMKPNDQYAEMETQEFCEKYLPESLTDPDKDKM